jgi:hypothetical protein
LFLAVVITPVAGTRGKHIGDARPLEIEIVYLNPPGTLTIDETGETYYFPVWDFTWHVDREYEEQYYGTYAIYFIGQTLEFEIRIRNTYNRTYRNLKVVAIQEYHLAPGTEYGERMPGDSVDEWFIERLGPGEEVVLRGEHYAGPSTVPGLNQTHVQVFHWSNDQGRGGDGEGPGRLFWDDPEAGVYCPPSFVIVG